MVRLVEWRVEGLEGDWAEARTATGYLPPPPRFDAGCVPVRHSSILRDGDDSTYIDLGFQSYENPSFGIGTQPEMAFARLVPQSAVPATPFAWYRITIRWSWVGYAPFPDGYPWPFEFDLGVYRGGGSDGMTATVWDTDPGDPTIRTSVGRFAPPLDGSGPFTIYEGDLELSSGGLGIGTQWGRGIFTPPSVEPVWVRFGAVWDEPGASVRIYDVLIETAYDGDLPLRQIQRDDHLAPGGTIRASTGTSRQGSIRARGYE